MVHSALIHQRQIDAAVARAAKALAPDVVRIRYGLGDNWAGEASIFFRIILSNSASRETRLRGVTQRAARIIWEHVKPEQLGLQPYFNYRSVSEQAELRDEEWA